MIRNLYSPPGLNTRRFTILKGVEHFVTAIKITAFLYLLTHFFMLEVVYVVLKPLVDSLISWPTPILW